MKIRMKDLLDHNEKELRVGPSTWEDIGSEAERSLRREYVPRELQWQSLVSTLCELDATERDRSDESKNVDVSTHAQHQEVTEQCLGQVPPELNSANNQAGDRPHELAGFAKLC